MHRFRSAKLSVRFLTGVMGGAFLLATNYCICEAFSHTHTDSSHQHSSSGHRDESTPTPEQGYDPCCTTLQAIVTPQASLLLAGTWQPFFQHATLPVVDDVRSADLSLAPSGLSPPARAPTPSRPFYRTIFASHAPPAHLS